MAGEPVVGQSCEDVAATELLHIVGQNGGPRRRMLYSRSALHGREAIQPHQAWGTWWRRASPRSWGISEADEPRRLLRAVRSLLAAVAARMPGLRAPAAH